MVKLMRTFYIFKINNEFKSLTNDIPYNLYKTFETIYNFSNQDFSLAYDLFNKVALPFNKKKLNVNIFANNRSNNNYSKVNNIHFINNYYTDEKTELVVKKTHLLLKTTVLMPAFFNDLKYGDLFVCDFENKDYFWLENLI